MTQDEKWQMQYDQVKTFMEVNHRRPSKYKPEELRLFNWFKHTKKMIAKGDYHPDRIEKFALHVEMALKYRRKNQYE